MSGYNHASTFMFTWYCCFHQLLKNMNKGKLMNIITEHL